LCEIVGFDLEVPQSVREHETIPTFVPFIKVEKPSRIPFLLEDDEFALEVFVADLFDFSE
jgi:hypothetical protein